jgi:hypothetical protein
MEFGAVLSSSAVKIKNYIISMQDNWHVLVK